LLSYFYLLLNGWTDIQIRRHYQFEELQTEGLRARLVELGLIEALPKRGYRLLVSRQIIWKPDGPVRRAYEHRVQQEFLRSAFTGPRDYLAWQPVELTDSSIDVLRRKFGQIYREFLGDGGARSAFVPTETQRWPAAGVSPVGILPGRGASAAGCGCKALRCEQSAIIPGCG
jgi:hypothetical protein